MQELMELKYKINNDIRDIEILCSENPDNNFYTMKYVDCKEH